MKRQIFGIIILLILLIVCDVFCATSLSKNPCPDIFKYITRNGKYAGEVNLPNIGENPLKMDVNISLPGYFNNLKWNLELVTPHSDIEAGQPLKYYVNFPLPDVLPKITQISLNNRVYCSGPPVPLLPGTSVTNAWATLTHTASKVFFTLGIPPNNNNIFGKPVDLPEMVTVPSRVDFNSNPFLDWLNHKPTTESPSIPQDTTPSPVQDSTTKKKSNDGQCGVANTGGSMNLVINGVPTKNNEYPWVAAMFYYLNGTYHFKCAANLISDRHVVTAAHCVKFYNAFLFAKEDMVLIFGRSNLTHWVTSGAQIRQAEKMVAHPDYKHGTGHGDVCVITLNEPLTFSKDVRPICLWVEDIDVRKGGKQTGTIAGWGTDGKGAESVLHLNKVELPVVSQEVCLRSNPAFRSITSNMTFCAGGKDGRGPCTGDSGAGFMVERDSKYYLRGIVSYAIGSSRTCDVNDYFVFCDLAKYASWIEKTMKTD